MSGRKRVALVLAGGAARGAYEVGVIEHVLVEVAAAIKRPVRFDILCGTSVGAMNACALAAWAHEGAAVTERLTRVWTGLELEKLVRTDLRALLPSLRAGSAVPPRESGVLDPKGLEELVAQSIPFERIDENLAQGFVDAVTVSTTHVQSGRTVVFVQTASGLLPPWSLDPTIEPRAAKIRAQHALASAAIPILFRSVRIDGEYHCDGGLRQNVPLSPARRLGADAVLVINPRVLPTPPLAARDPAVEEAFPGPLFLIGKTLNALMLDRIDTDLARLESVNRILEAGTRAFGPGFVSELNRALGHDGHGFRPLRAMLVRASQDIGRIAADFVRAHGASLRGFTGRLIRRLATSEGGDPNESDLLSYLLFDGRFARELVELGRADARARHDELCAFFDDLG
ncbi:MAG TPA: patatin-like phospholipase family protein [Minicystis sp.]|nr:patatin-like phospholipase family protein [Minicystis sp.]